MKGKVISLHDGFHMDVAESTVPPKAVVQFESGMKWERIGGLKY